MAINEESIRQLLSKYSADFYYSSSPDYNCKYIESKYVNFNYELHFAACFSTNKKRNNIIYYAEINDIIYNALLKGENVIIPSGYGKKKIYLYKN